MNEWREHVLGNVLTDNGYIRGPFGSALRRGEMKEDGIPVYEQKNAIYGSRDFRYFIDEEKFQELKRFQVETNDLIISCFGTVGKISIIQENDPKGIISQALLILRPDTEKITLKFLYYFLSSKVGYQYLTQVSHGSVQVNIAKRADVEQIPIPLPPLPEQRAIAGILSSLDDKIDLLYRQNETLEALAQTLFRQSFVEEVKEEWEKYQLEDFVDVMRGLSYKGAGLTSEEEGIPMHNLNSVFEGGGYKFDGMKYYKGDYKERHKVYPGDVIVTNTEQGHDLLLIGYPAIVPKHFGEEGIFSQHIYRLKLITNQITNQFLYYLLMSYDVREQIAGATNGSTVNMLPRDGIEWATFKLPPINLIKNFSSIIQEYWDKKDLNIYQIHTLEKLRDTLLPKLMSGEISVKK